LECSPLLNTNGEIDGGVKLESDVLVLCKREHP